VGDRLGTRTRLVSDAAFADFRSGAIDAGFICGLPYIRLRAEPDPSVELMAAPLPLPSRYQSRPIYFSDVIVAQDSAVRDFADLRGRSWSFNDRDSHSGYLLTRFELLKRGLTPAFFGSIVEAGSHENSIRMVVDGEVDASAIDSMVLERARVLSPELERQVRVVETFGPSTIQPIVASLRLPADTRHAIHEALLAINGEPEVRGELAAGMMGGIASIADGHYNDIRRMDALVTSSRAAELA
jgi:phosphonate transport system substrate-binding protein